MAFEVSCCRGSPRRTVGARLGARVLQLSLCRGDPFRSGFGPRQSGWLPPLPARPVYGWDFYSVWLCGWTIRDSAVVFGMNRGCGSPRPTVGAMLGRMSLRTGSCTGGALRSGLRLASDGTASTTCLLVYSATPTTGRGDAGLSVPLPHFAGSSAALIAVLQLHDGERGTRRRTVLRGRRRLMFSEFQARGLTASAAPGNRHLRGFLAFRASTTPQRQGR